MYKAVKEDLCGIGLILLSLFGVICLIISPVFVKLFILVIVLKKGSYLV